MSDFKGNESGRSKISTKTKTTQSRTKQQGITNYSSVSLPIVGIGASAGGLGAFKSMINAVPDNSGMAFILIQHLDPTHESLMAKLIQPHTPMPVVQAGDSTPVKPNNVYIIPPNTDLSLNNSVIHLANPTQRRGHRTPIDNFFDSLARDQKEKAIGIILSGTGSDGTRGLKAIKNAGGMVVVQSPEEASYNGMLTSAIATGLVDFTLSAAEIPIHLINYVKNSYAVGHFNSDNSNLVIEDLEEYNTVLSILYSQLGHNFHCYKKNTVIRRIKRRMGIKQITKLQEYATFLRSTPDETRELLKDLLIGVTEFFRDKESWHVLRDSVFPELFQPAQKGENIRVWVPGCSTGEEPYTLSILMHEFCEKHNLPFNFQIFATDIDTNALRIARAARYPEGLAADVPPSLLNKYFQKNNDFYHVRDTIRDKVVFSVQNLINDPPFSKLNLISCRNLLIYIESSIQEKVFQLFHFSLKRGAYLLLGNSETVGNRADLFQVKSKKWRIYKRIETLQQQRASFPILPSQPIWAGHLKRLEDSQKPRINVSDIVKKTLLKFYAPSAILINHKHEVIYHYGETVNFLHYPTGKHSSDLYTLLREGLATQVRGAIHKAIESQEPNFTCANKVKTSSGYRKVNAKIIPLDAYENAEELLLICFQLEENDNTKQGDCDNATDNHTVITTLESELSATKEELENTIEELETSNEELKASNEEMVSMNEELQSSNEELETSKEELQSLNEELNTINSELQDKIKAQESTNNDLTNLVDSTNIAVIFLDTGLNIKIYTPAALELYDLAASDLGRPIQHITSKFEDATLIDDANTVLNSLNHSDKIIQNSKGRWYQRKLFAYRTQNNRIEGLVLTFEDITKLKEYSDILELKNQQYAHAVSDKHEKNENSALHESVFQSAPEAIIIIKHNEDDIGISIIDYNSQAEALLGKNKKVITGQALNELNDLKLPAKTKSSLDLTYKVCRIQLDASPNQLGKAKQETYKVDHPMFPGWELYSSFELPTGELVVKLKPTS